VQRTGRAGRIGTARPPRRSADRRNNPGDVMRGILLWLIGIPIPVIILLYLFHVI
jgi:hypothetical protein